MHQAFERLGTVTDVTSVASDVLILRVDVPITGLRPMWAREYQETYPAPPPSTIYGMLLSLIGVERENKNRYAGLRIAIAMAENTEDSFWQRREKGRIFRKFRRVAQTKKNADPLADRRPDYQELLLGLEFWLWVDDSQASHPLCCEIYKALDPEKRGEIVRHGALCLGESSHMVNEVKKDRPRGRGRFVAPCDKGFLSMPIWSDHKEDRPTLCNFEIREPVPLPNNPPKNCWITIAPP